MTRRSVLLCLIASVVAAPALGEESMPRRRLRPHHPASIARQPIAPLPTRHVDATVMPRADAAPVPNRDIEAPIRSYSMEARLAPDIFRSRMPGRTANTDGVLNQREERVYTPGAGARWTLPFFTR